MKNYLLILLSVLGVSVFASTFAPNMSADLVAAPQQDNVIEVNLMSEMSPIDEEVVAEVSETPKITVQPKTVAGSKAYTVTLETSSLVAAPSYSDIYRTGKLVYAHNTAGLFGNLKNLRLGETFSLSENGVSTAYRVVEIAHFTKVPYRNGENLVKCDVNYQNCSDEVWMGILTKTAAYHDVALMTCDGGLNTPNRLIILADKI